MATFHRHDHTEAWWSESEYRASVAPLVGDDVFREYTDHLVAVGIVRRQTRDGVPGYAFTVCPAVVVTPIHGGH